jgi:iron complex outermembrane recepter protein
MFFRLTRSVPAVVLLSASCILAEQGVTLVSSDGCTVRTDRPVHTLSGSVADTTGARVPSATVKVTCGTYSRTTETDANGIYALQASPGSYVLEVVAEGFATSRQTLAFDSSDGQRNITLTVGSSDSTITVSASAGYVASDSSVGTKTQTSLLETPQAISVITEDQLTSQNVESVGAALRYSAGINGEAYGGADQRIDWYVVRGFTDTASLLDGLSTYTYYTLLSPKLETSAAERVEVLRGPSSTSYGATSPGGVINIISKRPHVEPLYSVGLESGSFGRVEGLGDLGGSLGGSDRLLYRVNGFARGGGTQVNHVDDHAFYLAPALTWQPAEKTSVTLLTHQSLTNGGWTLQYLPAVGTLSDASFGYLSPSLFTGDLGYDQYRRTEHAEGLILDHLFSNSVRAQVNARFNHSGLLYKTLMGAGFEADGHTLDRYVFGAQAQLNNFVSDSHVEWSMHRGSLQQALLAGFNYLQSNDTWQENDGINSVPLDLLQPNYRQTFVIPAPDYSTADGVKQTSVYLQDQLRWKRLGVTLNGREDWARVFEQDRIADTYTTQLPSRFTGRTGVTYDIAESLVPYFSYTTSFLPTHGLSFDGASFKPTTSRQFETGVKYKPATLNALFTLAAYNLTEQNVTTIDPNHPNFSVQTGEIRVRGLELESKLSLPGGIDATISYSYQSPEVTKSNDLDLGKAPINVPRNLANGWFDKTVHGGRWNNVGLGGGIRFTGYRWGDAYNTLGVPKNTLVDLAAHYTLNHWNVSANVTNLVGTRYIATCENTSRCVYGQSRSIFVRVNYQW